MADDPELLALARRSGCQSLTIGLESLEEANLRQMGKGWSGARGHGERLGRLRLDRVGVFPGSLGHYGGVQQGMPVVTIELEHALDMPSATEVRSMWSDLLRWMDQHLQPRNDLQKPPHR